MPIPEGGDYVYLDGEEWIERGYYTGRVKERRFSYTGEGDNREVWIEILVVPVKYGGE